MTTHLVKYHQKGTIKHNSISHIETKDRIIIDSNTFNYGLAKHRNVTRTPAKQNKISLETCKRFCGDFQHNILASCSLQVKSLFFFFTTRNNNTVVL